MSYRLHKFEPEDGSPTVTLPAYNQTDDISPAPPQFNWISLPGGGTYDAWESDQAPGGRQTLSKRCTLAADSRAGLQTALDNLKAPNGKRGKLYMLMHDAATRGRWARFGLKGDWPSLQPLWADVNLSFESADALWRGTAHNETTELTTTPQTIVATNNGNANVSNAIVTLAIPPTAINPITSLTVALTSATEFRYAATLTAGDSLVIDCGAKSVKLNGSHSYSNFNLTANHARSDWLVLLPGNNNLAVTLAGTLLTDILPYMATGLITPFTYQTGFTVDKITFNITYYDGWQ